MNATERGTFAANVLRVSTTDRSISVTGEGKITVKPDTASLNLGVQVTASTATEALSRANASAASLIAALKAVGIADDDIATSGLSIYPQYNSKNTISGYQASNNVTITVREIGRTGQVIDAAAEAAGDNLTVGGVSFYVDDTEGLIGAARADAMRNARKRAGEYAAAEEATVGGVIQISETTIGGPVQPMFRAASMSKFSGGAGTPIETGTQELEVSVNVVYELS
jgi:uncharacterized protein